MRAQASSSALMARFGITASPTAPYQARRYVRRVLVLWSIGTEIVQTAALIATELVTNAAKAAAVMPDAAGADAGQIQLTLCYARQTLRIEVTDASTTPPVRSQVPADAENGRGMFIVEALTTEWSYSFLPAGGGKTVHCVLPAGDRPRDADELRAAS